VSALRASSTPPAQAPAVASAVPRVSALTGAVSSRNAKTVIHTGAKKPVPLDPASEPLAPRPRVPSGPTMHAGSSEAAPPPPTEPQGRGAGFFTMPATRPLRSRETVINNLMIGDGDPGKTTADDAVREAYYQEVFAEFVKFKVENNESIENFTYEKFATKLRANTAELMRRPGVQDVQFSVYLKDGKAALKARVVRDEAKADEPALPAASPEGPKWMSVLSPRPASAELRFPTDEEPALPTALAEQLATPRSVPDEPSPIPSALESGHPTGRRYWLILLLAVLFALALVLLT